MEGRMKPRKLREYLSLTEYGGDNYYAILTFPKYDGDVDCLQTKVYRYKKDALQESIKMAAHFDAAPKSIDWKYVDDWE